MSFAQLNQRANQIADALRADGIYPRRRVVLLLFKGSAFLQAFFALEKNWRGNRAVELAADGG